MNQGRLFQNGVLVQRGITISEALSDRDRVRIPLNSTFISHHNGDTLDAEALAKYLSSLGYHCYLDTLDQSVDGDSPDLEDYLREVIGRCDRLMAVVSWRTKSSWWVPLEIGVALEKEKHIATYLLEREDLPSYLWLWPMLWSYADAAWWVIDTKTRSSAQVNSSWRLRTRVQKRSYIRS